MDPRSTFPPVVLIPGCGGSQMEARFDSDEELITACRTEIGEWFLMWFNIENIIPYYIDCVIDGMKLQYDNVTRTTRNAPGVETRIPGFGNTSTVEWLSKDHLYVLSYFHDIVSSLIPLGYERGVSVRGAPYDFRKAPNEMGEYFWDLEQLIETTYASTEQKVVLVAHSMGAPLIHYFLNHKSQHWKDKHIEALVTLAGAWGGSVKAVNVYATGDNLGIPFLSSQTARREQVTLASLAFLLPSPELWGPDEVLIQTPDDNFTTSNFKEMFEAMELPDAYEMYLDTKGLLHNAPAPGVEIHCIHGEGIPTVEKMVYHVDRFPDYPHIVSGDGDGTVNARSMRHCLKWVNEQEQKIYHVPVPNIDHMDIIKVEPSLGYLVNLLSTITRRNEQRAGEKMENFIQSEKIKEREFLMKYPGLGEATQAAREPAVDQTHRDNTSLESGDINQIRVQLDETPSVVTGF
ncbi:lysosomal phospholipase A and acyltransferase-like isoform X1 [Procambarus clarkii]|uniref:lysosomal phospholipase A and acyltransferase-like isoform X1 n=2 Tax=Procambarus clarkii TaxID=6728 RepID=UPI003743C7CF